MTINQVIADMDDDAVVSDDDIYGDLDADIFAAPLKKPRLDENIQSKEYENLVKENHALKAKIKQLERDNRAYFNNMSALFLTAKNEIEKKNFIIKNLTDKLKQQTKSKSNLSPKEAEDILTRCQEALQESQAQLTLNEIKKCLKNEISIPDGRQKRFKFGNMSLYFFRQQCEIQRGEAVSFNPPSTNTDIHTTADTSSKQEVLGDSKTCATNSSENPKNKRVDNIPSSRSNAALACDTVLVNNADEDITSASFSGMDEMGLPKTFTVPQGETQTFMHDYSTRNLRRGDRGRPENDRNRDKNNRRNSGSSERYSNHKYSRSKDHRSSPPPERHRNRKGEDDRNHSRKDFDSRKTDNFRRHNSNSWRANDNRSRPDKSCRTESKTSIYSYPDHGKMSNSRSRSRSN